MSSFTQRVRQTEQAAEEEDSDPCPQCGRLYRDDQFWIACDTWWCGRCAKVSESQAHRVKQWRCAGCEVGSMQAAAAAAAESAAAALDPWPISSDSQHQPPNTDPPPSMHRGQLSEPRRVRSYAKGAAVPVDGVKKLRSRGSTVDHGYRGITPAGSRWRAQIVVRAKQQGSSVSVRITATLGTFDTKIQAAAAFDKGALLLIRGRNAKINFPLLNYLDADGNIIEDQDVKQRLEARGWVGICGQNHL